MVILNTRDAILPLLGQISKIPGITWDDTDVVELVMQYIAYEKTALADLHDKCLDLVSRATGCRRFDAMVSPQGWKRVATNPYTQLVEGYPGGVGDPWVNETTQIANALFQLGTHLFTTLRMLGLYTNGYLYYQFKAWLGHDMLLQRFEVADLHLNS